MSDVRIHAAQLLLPEGLVPDRVVTVADGRITAVTGGKAADADRSAEFVASAFVDIQINGGGGVQFNETPTVDALASIAAAARKGGTAAILPTFTGNHDDGRFATYVRKAFPQASDDEVLKRVLLSNAMLLTLRGVPTIYSGDEQGFSSDGGDQEQSGDDRPAAGPGQPGGAK